MRISIGIFEVFKTVCVDAAYYTFPSLKYLDGLAAQVPDDFRFGFKVTDAITIKSFPSLARFGAKAGRPNLDYLNSDLFATAFLKPLESIRNKVGILMFEFSRFGSHDYQHGAEFLADLARFLDALPAGWRYGVEMRNRKWLQPEYFDCLSRSRVTHVFNSWSAMPTVSEQMALPGSRTTPDLVAARFLLTPGRTYETAVKTFQPYDRTREVDQGARLAASGLVGESLKGNRKGAYLYINNRLEGNGLNTIAAVLKMLKERSRQPSSN
jgi:uncharacterized protein YecE (DUF72 family)